MPKIEVVAPVARDAIRSRIIDSVYAPGDRLVERAIAADLKVSRVPVRQALRDLVAEGYAVERPTGGVAVRIYGDEEIIELTEVGAALESVLVARLAQDPSRELGLLDAVLREAEVAVERGDSAAAVEANSRFHEVLASLARGVVSELLGSIAPRLRWLQRQHGDPAVILAEHRRLLSALTAGDSEGARTIALGHASTSREAFRALHGADGGAS